MSGRESSESPESDREAREAARWWFRRFLLIVLLLALLLVGVVVWSLLTFDLSVTVSPV